MPAAATCSASGAIDGATEKLAPGLNDARLLMRRASASPECAEPWTDSPSSLPAASAGGRSCGGRLGCGIAFHSDTAVDSERELAGASDSGAARSDRTLWAVPRRPLCTLPPPMPSAPANTPWSGRADDGITDRLDAAVLMVALTCGGGPPPPTPPARPAQEGAGGSGSADAAPPSSGSASAASLGVRIPGGSHGDVAARAHMRCHEHASSRLDTAHSHVRVRPPPASDATHACRAAAMCAAMSLSSAHSAAAAASSALTHAPARARHAASAGASCGTPAGPPAACSRLPKRSDGASSRARHASQRWHTNAVTRAAVSASQPAVTLPERPAAGAESGTMRDFGIRERSNARAWAQRAEQRKSLGVESGAARGCRHLRGAKSH
eukprot:364647-Chlamydomonas_euryale.AAC.2